MGNNKKHLHFFRADSAASSPKSFSSSSASDDDGYSSSSCNTTDGYASAASSPSGYSPSTPPKSPWVHLPGLGAGGDAAEAGATGLIASLVKEDGHVYSLAAAGDVLYTGTDSENVRVWRDRRELAGFRTGSGLVKAIVVAADGRIFTGHQDGKVRVWRADADDPAVHRRVGSLPRLADFLKSSVNPSSYVETCRGRRARAVWLRHSDAVSCLSLDEAAGLLYSGSWDRTFKVWRVSDSKCLESVRAHDDAVNTVAAAGFDNVVFTGSADGTVKVWRREAAENGESTRHVLERVLRKGESAVTAIAVSPEDRVVYVGSSDGLVTYWHWVHGEATYGGVLKGHKMAVMCLAVAGDVVVSGSADRTLCVWRREGPEHVGLAVLTGHMGPVKCVAMDEEESGGERRFVVYSGSLDGSVKVWRLADDAAEQADERAVPTTPPRAPVVPLVALPRGERRVIVQDGEEILLLWYKDQVYAIENRSPAEGAYTEGLLNAKLTQDGCIVCPSTDSTFDLRTGEIKEWYPKNPVLRALTPALRKLLVYPVKTDGENIYISIRGAVSSGGSAEIIFSGKAQPGVTASDVNIEEVRMVIDDDVGGFGFTDKNELINGKAAIIGFLLLIDFELLTGKGLLKGTGLLDFIYAVSRAFSS